jgi:hypothetical protein
MGESIERNRSMPMHSGREWMRCHTSSTTIYNTAVTKILTAAAEHRTAAIVTFFELSTKIENVSSLILKFFKHLKSKILSICRPTTTEQLQLGGDSLEIQDVVAERTRVTLQLLL